MADELRIEAIEAGSNEVEVTPDEEWRWLVATGTVMIRHAPDGRRYRIIDPCERGDNEKDPTRLSEPGQ